MTRVTPKRGQTLVEYGLLLGLIAIIIAVALLFLAPVLRNIFYESVVVDGETYVAVGEEYRITIDDQLYVAADSWCLDIDGDTIEAAGIAYVAVGEDDSIEVEGTTFFLADAQCVQRLREGRS